MKQHINDVVMIQTRIEDLFGCTISEKSCESLMLLASKTNNVDLEDMIQNTYTYHMQVRPCRNIFGALHYAITQGGWEIPEPIIKEKTVRSVYEPPSIEVRKAIYGLA